MIAAEFFELGLGDPIGVSAAHGTRVRRLIDLVLDDLPDAGDEEKGAASEIRARLSAAPRRQIDTGQQYSRRAAGGDCIRPARRHARQRYIDFRRSGRRYTIIDTAGMPTRQSDRGNRSFRDQDAAIQSKMPM